MRKAASLKVSNVGLDNSLTINPVIADKINGKCSVRVSPEGYLSALFFFTFVACFLSYHGFWSGSFIVAIAGWTVIPGLLWFDRLEFDGKSLSRKGPIAAFFGFFSSQPRRLKIADIERIETQSWWTLKTGGRIFYRYRSEIYGSEMLFSFASSGGRNYRQMVKTVFSLVPEDKLDARSLELRDFLTEPKELKRRIKKLKLPSSEILDNALPKVRRSKLPRDNRQNLYQVEENAEISNYKSVELRQIANELRIAGNVSQAMEAYRRALLWQPENARLLFEFSRGLMSSAVAAKNMSWRRRSMAALKLAASRGKNDAALLTRIGESYFHSGDFESAAKTFRRALEISPENFRAECGLGEIGLQDGKIAHVVHHFQAAMRSAQDAAAKRWAKTEAEYFSLLNSNFRYMETEFSRISWLDNVSSSKRICLRLTFAGLPVILIGLFASETMAAVGWATSAVTGTAWATLKLAEKILDSRTNPTQILEDE